MLWDVFCRVIDNFGDIGVSWRLSVELALRGERVRLWCDDRSALAWMAPSGQPGVSVMPFDTAAAAEPGDVVLEAFGADPPPGFMARMAACPAASRPAWIDLEHLSAEPYVERSHGLPSPQQAGPAAGLTRWFFFPGFSARTGGLIREPEVARRMSERSDRDHWLARHGLKLQAGERTVSLFCYPNPRVPELLRLLSGKPTLLLAAAGAAGDAVRAALGPALAIGALRARPMPFVPQPEYDLMLSASDLNFVRGEDSLVRAIWAGRSFVWQAYPQRDGVHVAKIDALLAAAGAPPDLARFTRWWNATPASASPPPLPDLAAATAAVLAWRAALAGQPDLVTRLQSFAHEVLARGRARKAIK